MRFARRACALAALLFVAACSDSPARVDAGSIGEDAGRDGGMGSVDSDAGTPPLASWDGGEPPPLRWTLPECAVAHGVIARKVLRPTDPNLPLGVVAVALHGDRLVLAYDDGFGAWGEIRDDAFHAFEQPRGGGDWPLLPSLLAVRDDRVFALAFSPLDYVPLLLEQRSEGLTQTPLQSLAVAGGELSLNPRTEFANRGWVDLQAHDDGAIQIVGDWVGSAAPRPAQHAAARVVLDADGNALGEPEWYDAEPDPEAASRLHRWCSCKRDPCR